MPSTVASAIDAIAADTDFSGVVSVSRSGERAFAAAYGLADRALGVPNTLDTLFTLASGAKTFTALGVASLIDTGELTLDTTLRSLRPDDELALVDPAVTVAHLLAHTSGVGDYIDEDSDAEIDEYPLTVPVDELACPEDFLPAIGGLPHKFAPGERFSYCNGGYVMLALIIEAASGRSYYDILDERVFIPTGMSRTTFPRSDELTDTPATGYLQVGDRWRSNIFHIPVRGCGDGGTYSTLADIDTFWSSLFAGRILPLDLVATMVSPKNDVPELKKRYGYGFWVRPDRDTVMLEGYDAGVSFRSAYDLTSTFSYTVIGNTTEAAWPIVKHLDAELPTLADATSL